VVEISEGDSDGTYSSDEEFVDAPRRRIVDDEEEEEEEDRDFLSNRGSTLPSQPSRPIVPSTSRTLNDYLPPKPSSGFSGGFKAEAIRNMNREHQQLGIAGKIPYANGGLPSAASKGNTSYGNIGGYYAQGGQSK
jgi:hypothetical protein